MHIRVNNLSLTLAYLRRPEVEIVISCSRDTDVLIIKTARYVHDIHILSSLLPPKLDNTIETSRQRTTRYCRNTLICLASILLFVCYQHSVTLITAPQCDLNYETFFSFRLSFSLSSYFIDNGSINQINSV